MKYKTILPLLLLIFIVLSISCVSASDNSTETDILSEEQIVSGNTAQEIQDTIDNAKQGDIINLGENKEYNLNNTISINKKITLKGNNVTIKCENGLQIEGVNDVEITGLTFISTKELPNYAESISGQAIYAQATKNLIISNCKFINYAYGIDMYSSSDAIVKNSWFTGTTTGVNPERSDLGTKGLQIMGSNNIQVINNTFYGQILDGLSIASGSSKVFVENNTFINNTYAIFYGGASTTGNILRNNKFITCGMINTSYIGKLGEVVVDYQNLPVISLQKSSSDIEITGNTFTVKNDNMIILSEAENTAHGFPSVIGSINISNNTVLKADPSVVDSSVTFYKITVVTSLGISTIGDIDVKDNNFTAIPGIDNFQIEFESITNEDNNVHIPTTTAGSILIINYVKDGRVNLKLTDLSGESIVGEEITYSINKQAEKTATTDEYGQIYINGLSGDVLLTAAFKGSAQYIRSDIEATLQLATKTTTPTTSTKTVTKKTTTLSIAKKTFKKKATKKITAILKSSGKGVKGKKITFKVNGKTYSARTNSKGVATVKIKLTKKGTFKYTAKFAGDSAYKAVSKTNKIVIK